MAGDGSHVQGFGLKAVGHFQCSGYQSPAARAIWQSFFYKKEVDMTKLLLAISLILIPVLPATNSDEVPEGSCCRV